MFCPNCGKQIADDFAFCPYCGKETSVRPKDQNENQYAAPSGENGEYCGDPQGYQSYCRQNYNPYAQQSPYTVPNPKKYPGKGLGIAGMVVGICSLVYAFMVSAVAVSIILGILGIVFGAVGIVRARSVGRFNGFAVSGLSCGIAALVVDLFFIILFVVIYGYYWVL